MPGLESQRVTRDGSPVHRMTDPIASSPPVVPTASPRSRKSTKLRKPPPITPKRFNRFFTPRSSASFNSRSKSARQLQDITKSVVNRSSSRLKLKSTKNSTTSGDENPMQSIHSTPTSLNVKRKQFATPPTSPFLNSSPSKRPCLRRPSFATANISSSPPQLPIVLEDDVEAVPSEPLVRFEKEATPEVVFCQPIKRIKPNNTSLRVLERSFGGLSTQGRGFRADPCIPSASYATRDFVSTERDVHSHRRRALAFSVTACNTNSLAAIAIETGRLHIVDTAEGVDFEKCHIMIKALDNAITDVVFSADDMTLALACGDKTMRLIDMQTQKTKMVFENHLGCVKQVRYRPGDENVLATSCREGIVNLWDTRCKGEMRPIMTQFVQGDTRYGAHGIDQDYRVEFQTNPMRSWPGAHSDRLKGIKIHDKNAFRDLGKGDVVFADKDISVTALTFLSPQRNHLLVTGSEADASLRLWDIRGRSSRRAAGDSAPVSATGVPSNHRKVRNYGITSIATNTDCSRIYALSRDSTVYAYSSQHLVLGGVPEMLAGDVAPNRYATENHIGLGPLYGLKHPNLSISSFYIKGSMRPAHNDKPELLATGSADGSVFLFPTDEGELRMNHKLEHPLALDPSSATPVFDENSKNATPIFNCGTRLAHGHTRKFEVCNVTWTRDGSLISCSDDLKSRIWRENATRAKAYRQNASSLGTSTNRIGFAEVDEAEEEDDW